MRFYGVEMTPEGFSRELTALRRKERFLCRVLLGTVVVFGAIARMQGY
jgi:hypothetical protein